MTIEEALVIIDTTLNQEHLSNLQELVFQQCWEGRTYSEIAEGSGYDHDYIRDVGFRLWQLLSKTFGEKVNKSNFQSVLRRKAQQTQVSDAPPETTDINVSSQFTQTNWLKAAPNLVDSKEVTANKCQDWGEATDVSVFYGRTEELSTLTQWIINDRCRLVALLGMGGIGKTSLCVKLAEQIQGEFEYLIWRSLLHAPPIENILAELIQFLSSQQETDLPKAVDSRISQLIKYLQAHRCLLVLDNTETLLASGGSAGYYREGYESYSELFRRVGETRHQSCLVLTSREKPEEVAFLEGETLPVRSLQMKDLNDVEAAGIFKAKGLSGSKDERRDVLDWLEQAGYRTLSNQFQELAPLESSAPSCPFIAGPPIIHPRYFFGRERELKRLFNLLKSPPLQNAAIIGPRRSGKTSLLFHLKSITTTPPAQLRCDQRADWLPRPERYRWIFVDFQDPRLGNREGLLRYLLACLHLPAPNSCDLDCFLDVMSRSLRAPTVILLDEIGVALQRYPELNDSFWEALRSLSNNQVEGNLAFVLAASEPPEKLACHSSLGSPFFNIFGFTAQLKPLTDEEARELIASSPICFPAADIDWILAQSRSWPLLLQILCRERLIALEVGETDEAWKKEGLEQIKRYGYLLEN